jgi:hypothetical protein
VCPTTGRARLGYDRARILFQQQTGWDLHQLRHFAATHPGDQGVPLQLIMAKTRRRNPAPSNPAPRSPCSSNHQDAAVERIPKIVATANRCTNLPSDRNFT